MAQFEERCFHFNSSSKATFREAQMYCRHLSGTLVNVLTREENNAIFSLLNGTDAWLSASKARGHKYRWHSGNEIFFDNFNKQTPTCDQQLCCGVYMTTSGQWSASTCNYKRNYVCEVEHVNSGGRKELKSTNNFTSVVIGLLFFIRYTIFHNQTRFI